MVTAVEQVLNDLGWNEGFRIPIANAENKRLEEEVGRKSRLSASLRTTLENTQERIREIRRHATDVKHEEAQRRRLLGVHSAEVEAEQRLYQLAQADESKCVQEVKQNEKKTKETDDRLSSLQANVSKLTKKLDSIKKSILVDRDRLLAWEEKLNEKEEKNMVIEQFVKSDEKTFKKIELERLNLNEKLECYRQAVVKSVDEVQELELGLERTGRLYGQAVQDRRQLMSQWSQSVQVLTQRDKAIYDALRDINELREIAKQRMDGYQEQERFFEIQLNENRELDVNIKQLERDLLHFKSEEQKLASTLDSFSVEYQVQKKQLQDLARKIQDTRSNVKRKKSVVQNKYAKLQECKSRVEDLKQTLKSIDSQKMNTEERTLQLEEMVEREEKRKVAMIKETSRQQALLVRSTQRLSELESELMVLRLRHEGEIKRAENLKVERANVEKALRSKKEWTYKIDVELQRCEMRLALVLGQIIDKKEQEAKQHRIEQLKRISKEKNEVARTLSAQLAQVENDIRMVAKEMANYNEEVARMTDKKQTLALLVEGGEKQLKTAQASYEERKVEESLLELKLKEATKLASKVDDKLFDLEECAIHMEAAMQERRSAIKMQKERLSLQRKIISAENYELKSALTERRTKIQQLQARYDVHLAVLGKNPEDGGPLTLVYLLMQSAQERYLLQERGNKLDLAVRKAEAEIRSMENTLRLVNVCNSKYKSSLSMVDDNAPEKAQQRKLDDELFEVLQQLRKKRQALCKAQEDLKRMEENCEQLDKDVKRVKEEKEDKRLVVANLEQQITDQKEKINRADKNLRKVLRDIQNKCICTSDETIILQERDIAVRELSEQNTLALQRIAEFTIRHIEAELYVKRLLAERKIELPSSIYLKTASTTPQSTCRSENQSLASSRSQFTARSKLSSKSAPSRDVSRMIAYEYVADFSGSTRSGEESDFGVESRSLQKK